MALFPHLEQVKVLMVPAIRLRDKAVLGDEGALMAVSRWVTGERRGFWARRAVEGALVEPVGVMEGWCWVGDMVRRLVGVCSGGMGRAREREAQVNIVVEHVAIEWKGWWAWPGVDVMWYSGWERWLVRRDVGKAKVSVEEMGDRSMGKFIRKVPRAYRR